MSKTTKQRDPNIHKSASNELDLSTRTKKLKTLYVRKPKYPPKDF